MANTTYDQTSQVQYINNANNLDSVSMMSGSSKRPTGKYKKYNINDYQKLQSSLQTGKKMGGLGANIGSDKWEQAKRKKETQAQYANNLKAMNQYT